MSEVSIAQTGTQIEKTLATYALASGFHNWTKSGGSTAWDSFVALKKFVYTIKDDQSARLILPDATYRVRFGLCSTNQRTLGTNPAAWWELLPGSTTTITFSDDFSTDFGTPDYDTSKWGANGVSTVAIVSGALRITRTGPAQGLRSVNTFDFTNKGVSLKQTNLVSGGTVANAFFIAPSDGSGTFWQMEEYNGNLICWNEGVSSGALRAYNATTDLYKRIRFSGNTAIFEVSADGSFWTQVYSATSNAARTALYIYLQSWCSVSHTVQYDDIKFGTQGQATIYKAYEGSTLVYAADVIPGADDELRIQVVKESGNYKLKWLWRDDSGSSEVVKYTSTLTSAQVQALFPIFVKGEIYDNGGVLRNLQIEVSGSDTLDTLEYTSEFRKRDSFPMTVNFKMGLPEIIPVIDIWMPEIYRPMDTVGLAQTFRIPKAGTTSLWQIITGGVNTGSMKVNFKINGGAYVLASDLTITSAAHTPSLATVVELAVGDKVEIYITEINGGAVLTGPNYLRLEI